MKEIVFVPTIGDEVVDVVKNFDWYDDSFIKNADKCADLLSDGVNRFSALNSYYERPEDLAPESRFLGAEATANEAKKIGIKNLAEIITADKVEDKKIMQNTLVNNYAPKPEGPKPQPRLDNSYKLSK